MEGVGYMPQAGGHDKMVMIRGISAHVQGSSSACLSSLGPPRAWIDLVPPGPQDSGCWGSTQESSDEWDLWEPHSPKAEKRASD